MLGFFIRRKTLVSMFFIACSLLGYISYRQLPLEMLPNVEMPFLVVNVSSQIEMDPEYVEKNAVISVEGAVGTLEGIDQIETSVTGRRATLYLYYNQGVDLNYAYLKLQDKVAEVSASLPEEFTVRAVKVDTERLTNTFMTLQARGGGGEERVRSVVDEEIVPALMAVDGIANVSVSGGKESAVEVILDSDACKALGITQSDVRSAINQGAERTFHLGNVVSEGRRYPVTLLAEYQDVGTLGNVIVSNEGPVYLRDIATVVFGEKEETSRSRVNGKNAVSLQIVRDSQVNLIDLSHATKKAVEDINRKYAHLDVELVIQTNSADDLEENVNLIMQLALAGGICAVIVLWFFLRNFRLVLAVMLAIPVSILTAFNFFYSAGVSLNTFTLIGLALAIGMLLDNSVVVLENIYRHVALGKEPFDAVVTGTKEVWRAIVASTLTTVTVFIPFIFSSEYLVKLIGRHIGVSVISTLFVSLVVALMLVPMITHAILTGFGGKGGYFNRVSRRLRLLQMYTVILKTSMRYPARVIGGAVVLFFISVMISLVASKDVPQEVDSDSFGIYLTMSQGATLDQTDDATARLEARIEGIDEIRDVVSEIYEDEARVQVILKENFEEIAGRSIAEIREAVDEKISRFTGATVSLSEPSQSARFGGGMTRNPVNQLERMFGIGAQQEKIIVKGEDFDTLLSVAESYSYQLSELDTIDRDPRLSVPGNQPEIHLYFDTLLLSLYDIPLSNIATELSSFQGDMTSSTQFVQGNDEYDILISMDEETKEPDIDDLRELDIYDTNRVPHPLENLSQVVFSSGKSRIQRVNKEKLVEVTFAFDSEINDDKTMLAEAREEVEALVANIPLPDGVAVEIEHDESDLSEFYFLIGAAFILIYMILASVFESLLTPVVMMFTIPLAAIGAFWALIITGKSLLNANSMVGLLILLGVVVNNGIILIDYTRTLRLKGYRRERALLAAGLTRVRPILITAITTIVGMLPLAMGNTEQLSQLGAPFAITVIGGLSLSTLFTLVFIPTVYSGLDTSREWIMSRDWRIRIMMAVSVAALIWLIQVNIGSLLWRWVLWTAAVCAVPALTWFVLSSLRRARADIVGHDERIVIHIRRIVKRYDDFSRFVREWRRNERMVANGGESAETTGLYHFRWQLPILAFLIYFNFMYLESSFWNIVLSPLIYLFLVMMLSPLWPVLKSRGTSRLSKIRSRLADVLHALIVWLVPVAMLMFWHGKGLKMTMLVFAGLIWYAAVLVYTTSSRLHRLKTNIYRLTGRFTVLRGWYYRLVMVIPVIGRRRKPFSALNGVSLEITSGMFGLLGPNGAGKTTIMRIICGILNQSMGTIRINDYNYRDSLEELQGLIGYLPQHFGTYENMTAWEFLDYIAILKGLYDPDVRHKRLEYVLNAVHLRERSDSRIGSFSGGMKQRVGIALILLNLPRILVVDEPTAGLDPRERIRFRNLLVELSRDRVVVFSTHIIEDIASSCRKVAVLHRGSLRYTGDPLEMQRFAQGHVWQFAVTGDEFDNLRETLHIVHHMQVGNMVNIRCIAQEQPWPGAVQAKATLEDAYLVLLGPGSHEEVKA